MNPRLRAWLRRIPLLLGIGIMGAATVVSRPHEEGFWGAPRACRAWSDPCTHEQARAVVLRAEQAWWLGVLLVVVGVLLALWILRLPERRRGRSSSV